MPTKVLLVFYCRLRDALRPAGGVKAVCARLTQSCDQNTANRELAIRTLRALSNNNRYNKEAMAECKMADIFFR